MTMQDYVHPQPLGFDLSPDFVVRRWNWRSGRIEWRLVGAPWVFAGHGARLAGDLLLQDYPRALAGSDVDVFDQRAGARVWPPADATECPVRNWLACPYCAESLELASDAAQCTNCRRVWHSRSFSPTLIDRDNGGRGCPFPAVVQVRFPHDTVPGMLCQPHATYAVREAGATVVQL